MKATYCSNFLLKAGEVGFRHGLPLWLFLRLLVLDALLGLDLLLLQHRLLQDRQGSLGGGPLSGRPLWSGILEQRPRQDRLLALLLFRLLI